MRAPRGARTVSSVIRAPERVSCPRIRTNGAGRIIRGGCAAAASSTWMRSGDGADGAAGSGEGAAGGSGDGDGEGEGDGDGEGEGEGSGAGVTAALSFDSARDEPSSLRTSSSTRSREPRSASVTR